ncbi:MAG TPA: RNA methyltransferase [Mycobacteriales bacterium]|nr:RNA methyltransferase [Mycobacteriales bacterium]
MRDVEEIADPGDPRLVDYVGLTDMARRVRTEPARGFFLAEGETVMRRAAEAGYPPRSMLLSPERLAALEGPLADLDCPRYVASYDVLHAVTGFHVHRGALASFGRLPLPSVADVSGPARRLVVLEDVNNHTNLGAIIRSCSALGMDALLLSPRCCDPLYRRSVRVSMGAALSIPYAYLNDWPGGLTHIRDQGFRLLALTPAEDAVPLSEIHVDPEERVALLLGAEGPGLSDAAMAVSTDRVRIPMYAGIDSLNVAAAAAVACWEVGNRGLRAP